MRLAIGTAQFGSDYGVSSAPGRLSTSAIKSILRLARKSGIDTLDTAAAYGDSEEILGSIGVSNWRIVTKVPRYDVKPANIRSWLMGHVQNSLEMLNEPTYFSPINWFFVMVKYSLKIFRVEFCFTSPI